MTLGRGLTILAALFLISAAPATQPGASSSLSGRVFAKESDRALSQIVVYLEPVDATRRFDRPTAPAIISQRDARFLPSLLVIAKGQSVEFRNDESRAIEHNVFSRSPLKPFDLGLYRPGTPNKTVTFEKPGVVRLYCSIHRYMDGVIYVASTPFFATIDGEGRYKIENVPPGEYLVRTWQRNQRYPEQEQRVTLGSGTSSKIDLEFKSQ